MKKITSHRIAQLLRSLSDQELANIKIEDIATRLNWEPVCMSRIFKAQIGITLRDHIEAERMCRALSLLKANKVLDVSKQLGYCRKDYFSSIFRKRFGCSPSHFAKALRRVEEEL